jgi:hypothetical protein
MSVRADMVGKYNGPAPQEGVQMTTNYLDRLDRSKPQRPSRLAQIRAWYRSRTRAKDLRKAEDGLARVVAEIAAGKVPPEERAFLLRRLEAIRTELDGHIQAVAAHDREEALTPDRDTIGISAFSHA